MQQYGDRCVRCTRLTAQHYDWFIALGEWAVTFSAGHPSRCTKRNNLPVKGQCTNQLGVLM